MEDLYRTLALRDRHARAYVMLMIGNRRPMSAWRKRSLMAEKLIAREQSGRIPLTPRQVTAVIRMFVSTMGWHLLTEQCGLSTDEAAAASAWATRTLLDAAIAKRTTKRTAKPSSSSFTGRRQCDTTSPKLGSRQCPVFSHSMPPLTPVLAGTRRRRSLCCEISGSMCPTAS